MGFVIIGMADTMENTSTNITYWERMATLRINQNINSTLELLLAELHVEIIDRRLVEHQADFRVLVEYEKCGCRSVQGKEMMWLDLRPGQKVRMVESHGHDEVVSKKLGKTCSF